MQFKDIVGQEQTKQQLRLSVQEGRVPHAQMLYGQSGVGKLQLAIAYAQYLACPNRTETDSCGVCPSCLQYKKLQHPDLHFVFPIYKEKPGRDSVCDDFVQRFREIVLDRGYFNVQDWLAYIDADSKQGMIYEAESSEILRKMSLKAYSGGYKTMIIWLPEKMHTACANKLLKLLEEPPQDTVFLLVSDAADQILTTILSRTQQIHVPKVSEDEIAAALRSNYGVDIERSMDVAHIANGSYLTAIKTIENSKEESDYFEMFQNLFREAWQVGHRKRYDSLLNLKSWVDKMVKDLGREKQKAFLQFAQNQLRENYIYNIGEPDLNYQTHQESEFSRRFAPFINENNVEQLMYQLELAERQITQNANARFVFFDLCLQVIVLMK